jgi:hypothetical protein
VLSGEQSICAAAIAGRWAQLIDAGALAAAPVHAVAPVRGARDEGGTINEGSIGQSEVRARAAAFAQVARSSGAMSHWTRAASVRFSGCDYIDLVHA